MRDRDELEALVAYYESELGIMQEATHVDALCTKYRLTLSQARVLLPLAISERVMNVNQLFDAIPHVKDGDETTAIRLHVWGIRRKMGMDTVRTIPGLGYKITPSGKEAVQSALEAA